MGSVTKSLCIPTIDFSKPFLKPSTSEWESVRSQVWKAFEQFGCFKALFDKISEEHQLAVFGSLKELFGLPSETKELNASKKPLHGYINIQANTLSYESFGIEDPTTFDSVESLSKIFWPQGHPCFSKTIASFSKEVSELELIIKRMVVESLGVEKYLEEHINSMEYLVRVNKYEGPQTTEKHVRLNSHTDKNVLTILSQNQVDGLEVQIKDGEWLKLEFTPNSFTVLAGESLTAWTNGRVQPPYHRVVTSGNVARYSLGLFSLFKPGYLVQAPEELVDDEHPLQYKPFDYFEYLNYQEPGKGNYVQITIKAYCGA